MEVRDQPLALAALLPRKEPAIPIEQEAVWIPEPVCTFLEERKINRFSVVPYRRYSNWDCLCPCG